MYISMVLVLVVHSTLLHAMSVMHLQKQQQQQQQQPVKSWYPMTLSVSASRTPAVTSVQDRTETEIVEDSVNSLRQRRVKRASGIDGIEDAFKNFGLSGTLVYVARKSSHIRFEVDPQRFSSDDILLAELHLYKIRPQSLKFLKKAEAKETRKARVSIHQVVRAGKYISETKLMDTRRVHVKASGWLKFDITRAMKDWSRDAGLNQGLEIWVESTEPGEFAAKIARKFRFIKPEDNKTTQHRPSLVVVFKNRDTDSSY